MSDQGWTQIDFDRDIEVGDRIGGGGVGIIYKGWYKDEPVALKVCFVYADTIPWELLIISIWYMQIRF